MGFRCTISKCTYLGIYFVRRISAHNNVLRCSTMVVCKVHCMYYNCQSKSALVNQYTSGCFEWIEILTVGRTLFRETEI